MHFSVSRFLLQLRLCHFTAKATFLLTRHWIPKRKIRAKIKPLDYCTVWLRPKEPQQEPRLQRRRQYWRLEVEVHPVCPVLYIQWPVSPHWGTDRRNQTAVLGFRRLATTRSSRQRRRNDLFLSFMSLKNIICSLSLCLPLHLSLNSLSPSYFCFLKYWTGVLWTQRRL